MKRIEDILAQCIEDIKAGKASLADCLDRYPSTRQQLEPLLRIALSIQEPPDVKPSDAFKMRTRGYLMEHIHAGKAAERQELAPARPAAVLRERRRERGGLASGLVCGRPGKPSG